MGSPITLTAQQVVVIADYSSWPGGGGFTTPWQLVDGYTVIIGHCIANIDFYMRSVRVQQNVALNTDHGMTGDSRFLPFEDMILPKNTTEVVTWKIPVRARYARMYFADPCGGGVVPFRVYCAARSLK